MEKAQKGDLIRIVESEDAPHGTIYEVIGVDEMGDVYVDDTLPTGEPLFFYDDEYVIHRKAGEEDAPTVGKVMENIAKLRDDVVQAGKSDAVNPQHYKQGRVEVIDIIEDAVDGADPFEAVCQANVLKYALRYRHKNGVEDLRKSIWYTEKLIAYLDAKSTQC